ncbi:hypothetical protein Desca_0557 [Desulfotomaculum nigrificans CO-1-SRB]|uniref:Uncharacterized protein n=1 Tax=Desulfotomaculum nigrificans (strain DSM 14880 / VKM B-2319 / CO-1-SRB) TaxID=868595 RepID=F6B7S5_DESCC|nr:hypothetical protein [Desulfotomaculum nigrificans]AEF93447.1 hypothetical protein Desca_0557 [Desulfotomaculum nigrificans CO-1-SRB]
MSEKTKSGVLKTLLLLALAAVAYILIFTNIDMLNKFYLSKGIIPAIALLATIIGMAALYGSAAASLLGLLGLESKH